MFSFNVNLMPHRVSKARRLAGVAGASFFLGALLSLVGLGTALGTDPLSLIAGDPVGTLLAKKTPSERLIAQGSVIEIAKKVQPSVVGIQTEQTMKDDLFHRDTKREAESVGSGVIIRSDGYIMTNSHVVNQASSIYVTFGEQKLPAQVVGRDEESDIAVIKVSKSRLPVAILGSSKRLEVGELAVAIGSPFGFQSSVTAGVISALNRNVTVNSELDRAKTYTHLIQTDAAINPGNSGGALINQKGEVVGINTLIYSTNGVSQGIGFAIPVEEAKTVARELVATGKVNYPYIGIEGRTVDPQLAKKEKLGADRGALVLKVTEGGPAALAGIEARDVITEYDRKSIKTMDDLVAAVRKSPVNTITSVKTNRDGLERESIITPAPRPGTF